MVNPHLPQPTSLRCLQIKVEPDVVTIAVESLAPFGICLSIVFIPYALQTKDL